MNARNLARASAYLAAILMTMSIAAGCAKPHYATPPPGFLGRSKPIVHGQVTTPSAAYMRQLSGK